MGLKVKWEKCLLRIPCMKVLGFALDTDKIYLAQDKIHGIFSVPALKTKTELQVFFGLLKYYHTSLQDKAVVAKSLHKLLDKCVQLVSGPHKARALQGIRPANAERGAGPFQKHLVSDSCMQFLPVWCRHSPGYQLSYGKSILCGAQLCSD